MQTKDDTMCKTATMDICWSWKKTTFRTKLKMLSSIPRELVAVSCFIASGNTALELANRESRHLESSREYNLLHTRIPIHHILKAVTARDVQALLSLTSGAQTYTVQGQWTSSCLCSHKPHTVSQSRFHHCTRLSDDRNCYIKCKQITCTGKYESRSVCSVEPSPQSATKPSRQSPAFDAASPSTPDLELGRQATTTYFIYVGVPELKLCDAGRSFHCNG